jgi:NADPH:quinone reductase-like Zn-dependent oxidoreductase
MKAVVYDRYGTPDVLTIKEIPKPVPKNNEVLVRVRAASINSWDWDMIRGEPFFVRMWGLFKPKHTIPGADIAGTVEAVGKDVKKFKPGDDVFGDLCECGWGGFAEYACAPEGALMLKPEAMTFAQAAATPQAGAMALQSLVDVGKIHTSQKVLINGGGGGVGTFAIQLASLYGAEVTAVDTQSKHDMMRKLGAHHVIDYTQEDFTESGKLYDVIVDVIANRPLLRYKKSLQPNGIFIMIGGTAKVIMQAMLFGRFMSLNENKKLTMLAYKPNSGLQALCELFANTKIHPVIDREFSLEESANAFRYYIQGNFVGKIIINA